jgi:hypothetical protein
MSIQPDLVKEFREQQQKFCYYIIALCVAGIGFAIQKTIGLSLSMSQIPLGAAVLSLGLSIHCGLNFLGIMRSALYSNIGLINVQEGRHPVTGTHPEKIQIGVETIMKGIEAKSKQTTVYATWQTRFFYIGIIAFVGWRVWEMYKAIN